MSSWTPSFPVLIPAAIVTAGWIVAIKKRVSERWRMALFTASLAVFFLGVALSLIAYRKFSADVEVAQDFKTMYEIYPNLVDAVSMLKVSALALGAHLLLASIACQFPPRSNRSDDSRIVSHLD